MAESRSVVVLGMHRSGTSVVTRVLNLLGLPLCRPDDLYSAPDNPTGHWESISLVAMNNRILASLGGRSERPVGLDPNWWTRPEICGLDDIARETFNRTYRTSHWVWKDPRTCLTLPFWCRVWGVPPVVVLVSREPLEIVASLARRDGMRKGHSLALWERYLRSALSASSGLPTAAIQFHDLLGDPFGAVSRLRDDLESLDVALSPELGEAVAFVQSGQSLHSGLGLRFGDDTDATRAQLSLHSELEALPPVSEALCAPDLPSESSTTVELLDLLNRASRRPHPADWPVWLVRRVLRQMAGVAHRTGSPA